MKTVNADGIKDWGKFKNEESRERLAKLLHDKYNAFALECDWSVKPTCIVDFEYLPEPNKKVMLKLAGFIIKREKRARREQDKKWEKKMERLKGQIKDDAKLFKRKKNDSENSYLLKTGHLGAVEAILKKIENLKRKESKK